jgi:hypothetical protein
MQEKRREVRLQGAPVTQVSLAQRQRAMCAQQRAPSSHTEECSERHARVFG